MAAVSRGQELAFLETFCSCCGVMYHVENDILRLWLKDLEGQARINRNPEINSNLSSTLGPVLSSGE